MIEGHLGGVVVLRGGLMVDGDASFVREDAGKLAAFAQLALHLQVGPVCIEHVLHDRQAEACSAPVARSIRLWPAVLILVALLAALVWIWTSAADSRQDRVLSSGLATTVAVLLLVLWLAAFSRLAWKPRLAALGAVALAGLVLASLVRIQIRHLCLPLRVQEKLR